MKGHGSANQRSVWIPAQHIWRIQGTQPSSAGHETPGSERLWAVVHRSWIHRNELMSLVASGTPIFKNLALTPVPIFQPSSKTPTPRPIVPSDRNAGARRLATVRR